MTYHFSSNLNKEMLTPQDDENDRLKWKKAFCFQICQIMHKKGPIVKFNLAERINKSLKFFLNFNKII